jgi:hypothetical protein
MPNGIFPVPPFDSRPGDTASRRPSLAVRTRTWWRRNRLDDELAHGADPATSAELSLRAAQLRSRSERSRLANALVEALGNARRGAPVTLRAGRSARRSGPRPTICWHSSAASGTTDPPGSEARPWPPGC